MVLQLQALALPVMRAILSYLGEDPLSFDRKLTRETSRNSLRPRACPRAFGAQRTALLPPCRRARAWLCARCAALARTRPRARAATRACGHARRGHMAVGLPAPATCHPARRLELRLALELLPAALAEGTGKRRGCAPMPPCPMAHSPIHLRESASSAAAHAMAQGACCEAAACLMAMQGACSRPRVLVSQGACWDTRTWTSSRCCRRLPWRDCRC